MSKKVYDNAIEQTYIVNANKGIAVPSESIKVESHWWGIWIDDRMWWADSTGRLFAHTALAVAQAQCDHLHNPLAEVKEF